MVVSKRAMFWFWIALAAVWLVITLPISGLIWLDLLYLAGGPPTMGFHQSPEVLPIWKLLVFLGLPPGLVASCVAVYRRVKRHRQCDTVSSLSKITSQFD
jgi:hypothetical protein